jgi:uncharacterized protein
MAASSQESFADSHVDFDPLRYAAELGVENAQYQLGCKLFYKDNRSEDDLKEAIQFLISACDKGENSQAMSLLGYCYLSGTGVAQSWDLAKICLEEALITNPDDPLTMINLGRCLQNSGDAGKDEEKAFSLYKRAAELKDADGNFMVGVCYHKGIGVEKDIGKAIGHYRMAARENHADALCNLGVMYLHGVQEGSKTLMAKDAISALAYLGRSAQSGNGNALLYSGHYHLHHATPPDYEKAREFFSRASKADSVDKETLASECFDLSQINPI